MDWFGKHDDPNKANMTAVSDPPITATPSTPPPNNSFSSPAFAAKSPVTPKTETTDPGILSGNTHIQDEIDIIKSLPAEVPAELIVAIIDHQSEYLQAARTNTVSELLGNIRKFNPLIKSFYDHKAGSSPQIMPTNSVPQPQPSPNPPQPTLPVASVPEHPYQS